MTKYDDETIPIACPECPELDWENEIGCAYGVQKMYEHILEFHPDYNQHEADVYALKWAEKAYDREDEADEAYATSRREEPSE